MPGDSSIQVYVPLLSGGIPCHAPSAVVLHNELIGGGLQWYRVRLGQCYGHILTRQAVKLMESIISESNTKKSKETDFLLM